MSARPLVSIVTPCLDSGDWLGGCLASVAAQTYSPVEHLVIDGGSTDSTVELLRRTADVRWISEADDGQTAAINKGFDMARGDIVCWVNADDRLTPDAVRLVVDGFERHPTAGWIYGDSLLLEGGSERLFRPPAPLALEHLDGRNPLAQPGCFITRWALDRVGGLDERFDLAMDLDLWYRLIAAGIPSVYLPRTLAIIEVHPGTKTRSRPTGEWAEEFGAVRLKNGRAAAAAVAFGRSAAHAAAVNGRVRRRRLAREVRRVRHLALESEKPLPARVVWAGALTESAVIERHRPLGRLRHLLAPSPWTHSTTRSLIFGTGVSRASRAIRGVGRPDERDTAPLPGSTSSP